MKLPLFPLQSIFFPGETVPLHIFEERYKQLILDCRDEAITFGIPVYIDNNMQFGVEVQLVEVVTTYDNAEMDVVCVARQVFKLQSFESKLEDKLYAGGVVELLEYDYEADEVFKLKVYQKIKELYKLMEVPFSNTSPETFNSFTLAHKMGLSFEQEYELLQIPKEMNRLSFIDNHLTNAIAVLGQVERTRETIQLNGHFKNFDPLDFNDLEIE